MGPVRPSTGSRKGQHYLAAEDGTTMSNEGKQALEVMTDEGAPADMVFRITDVKKPVFSVGKLCDRGNRVIFGSGGGVIHNLKTNRLTAFRRKGGIYAGSSGESA